MVDISVTRAGDVYPKGRAKTRSSEAPSPRAMVLGYQGKDLNAN